MIKSQQRKLSMASAVAILLLGSAAAAAAPEPKVTICHAPPGNPGNIQTITIGASAVAAHAANHKGDEVDFPADGNKKCFQDTGAVTSRIADTLTVVGCINRPGKRLGNRIETTASGLIATSIFGCDL